MEMERKMARCKDGKLIKAAPFDSYSLRCIRRVTMERIKRYPLRSNRKGERWKEVSIHRLDVSGRWIWGVGG